MIFVWCWKNKGSNHITQHNYYIFFLYKNLSERNTFKLNNSSWYNKHNYFFKSFQDIWNIFQIWSVLFVKHQDWKNIINNCGWRYFWINLMFIWGSDHTDQIALNCWPTKTLSNWFRWMEWKVPELNFPLIFL